MLRFLKKLKENISRFNNSVDKYKKVTRKTSIPSKAYVNWGVYLASKGNIEEALEKFERSANMKPANPDSFNSWGVALATLERYEEAIEKFKKAIKLDPNHVKSHMLWGAALIELQNFEDAETAYKRALNIRKDDPEIYMNWGISLARQDMKPLAEVKFRKAFEIMPINPKAAFLLGVLLLEMEKYPEALEKLIHAAKLQPENPENWHYQSVALLKQNKLDESYKLSQKAVNKLPARVDFQIHMAEILTEKGEYSKAIECYDLAEKSTSDKNSDRADIYSSYGISLYKMADYEGSLQKLEKALELKEHNEEAQYYLALTHSELCDFDIAEELLEKIIKANPSYLDAYVKLGSICCVKGDLNKALIHYKKAAKFPTKKNEANFLVASTYVLMGDYENATVYHKKVLENDPNSIGANVGCAVALSELHDDKEAIRKIRKAYQLAPDSAQINMIYGTILMKDEKTLNDALEKFENTLKLNPEEPTGIVGKGETLIRLKKYNEAISFLNEELFKKPDQVQILFLIGAAYEEFGDEETDKEKKNIHYTNANEYYSKVLEIESGDIGALASIAYLRARQGDENILENELIKLVDAYPYKKEEIKIYFNKSIEKLNYNKSFDDIIAQNKA